MTPAAARPDPMPLIRLDGVGKTFRDGTTALAALDLTLDDGAFVAVLGPSGCGKSTALRLLAGLTAPNAGRIHRAAALTTPGAVGLVFQEPALAPWATARANVALPLRLLGVARQRAARRADVWLRRVGLAAFGDSYPRQLSGGG